jgi:hypothetical protein
MLCPRSTLLVVGLLAAQAETESKVYTTCAFHSLLLRWLCLASGWLAWTGWQQLKE